MANMLKTNGVIFSTLKHTDPQTVRGRPTLKDGVCNERIFRNGSFRELKIAKESNDLANVSLESNQKSNELPVNRKCGQSDRRAFADKDKVPRDEPRGNDNKGATLEIRTLVPLAFLFWTTPHHKWSTLITARLPVVRLTILDRLVKNINQTFAMRVESEATAQGFKSR